ncbi:MAG: 50S ribosomal protein L5 [Thermoplasmata archaeon]|nr:50S ribosomal protein L5 [Thermoplasmata archaeon]
MADKNKNPMREIFVGKVVMNIGVGEAGEKLAKADRVLQRLTNGRKIVQTISKTTNKDLGIREGMPIGVKITLRGKEAEEMIRRALWVRNNRLPSYCFDRSGNFSFGIPDYTSFEGQKYDPAIGIFGLDINVVLERKGYRVSRRKIARGRIASHHRVTPKEAREFAKGKFNLEVIG